MTVILAAGAGALFACGTWLLLQRRLSRIIIGLGLLSHGANLLLIASGRPGLAAFVDEAASEPGAALEGFVDPLPQALLLTAIVITFGVTAFLLAMAYRSWLLTGDDLVEDDREDRRIATEGIADEEVADEEALAASQIADELHESDDVDGEGTARPWVPSARLRSRRRRGGSGRGTGAR